MLNFLCRSWKACKDLLFRIFPIVVTPADIQEESDMSVHIVSSADKGKDSIMFVDSPFVGRSSSRL